MITILWLDQRAGRRASSGFAVGEKIALGYGATYPAVARYGGAVRGGHGHRSRQAGHASLSWRRMRLPASTNIKVTSVANISVGDKIRLDIDSVGHGIETVTVTRVGTPASRRISRLMRAPARPISRSAERNGFAVGDKMTIGTPANQETVTVTAVGYPGSGRHRASTLRRPSPNAHVVGEWVVAPGTGLDLAAPLRFNHAANLPFSARGTGISFQPETAFAHSSNEPVQPLGTGITLDSPLAKDHAIDAVVRDAAVKTAGYQGTPVPNQWFGGPDSPRSPHNSGVPLTVEEGSMVLRDASGLVVDSLNYGGLVDPWAAEAIKPNPEQS